MSVTEYSFSAFWRLENAISAHSSTGVISEWFWIYLCWDLKFQQRPPLSHSY